VIRDSADALFSRVDVSDDEMKSITSTMKYNAKLLNRMVMMLFDSSETGLSEELKSAKCDKVSCNGLARESIDYIKVYYPDVNIDIQTELTDDFCIQTNHLYLMRSLREVLYNSAKYSDGQLIVLKIDRHAENVRFIVQDTGKGINKADNERIFKFFAKIDDLSEGLGLGLPLAKRHAQNLGGDLTLDELYHDGCRFILEIPVVASV
jgi:signal transduction histidine kinase